MGCPVVHFEIAGRDLPALADFYSKMFDWELKPNGPVLDTAAGAGGIDGHLIAYGHDPHKQVTIYVEVDDIQASLDRAAALGGTTVVPPVTIPTGTFAWMSDPDGNTIGLWKKATAGS